MESLEIKLFAKKFINEHWQVINKERCEIKDNPIQLKKKIENEAGMASWIITEVMSWGCGNVDYSKPYLMEAVDSENNEINIWKINNKFYRSIDYILTEVFPKTKRVLYFD